MVLSRRASNLEHAAAAHPSVFTRSSTIKSIGQRIRSITRDTTRTRRLNRVVRSADHAKRKSAGKSKLAPATLQFNVTSVSTTAPAAPPIQDVEMQDAEPLPPPQPSLTTQTYRLPRELLRPAYQEISRETLQAVDPDLGDVDDIEIEYLRDAFEDIGPALYRTLASVVADPPKESLPKELVISVTDQGDFPAPTHLLAVYGSPSPAASSSSKDVAAETPRQVTLIPVHAVVLTIYCARLPPLIPTPASQERTPTYKVPVQPLCLPSPTTFPLLSSFLYTKRSSHLLKSLLPTPPPPTLTSTEGGPSESRTQHLSAFAATLASTYTAQALLRHIHTTHGLWQNACVLGVHDDGLWEVLELVWEVLLTAMAISAGTPDLMVKRLTPPPPEQEREQEEGEQGDAPDAEQAGSATASESGTPAPT